MVKQACLFWEAIVQARANGEQPILSNSRAAQKASHSLGVNFKGQNTRGHSREETFFLMMISPLARSHSFGQEKQKIKLFVAQHGMFGTPSLNQESPRESLYGPLLCVLFQEMRHFNFFCWPKIGFCRFQTEPCHFLCSFFIGVALTMIKGARHQPGWFS